MVLENKTGTFLAIIIEIFFEIKRGEAKKTQQTNQQTKKKHQKTKERTNKTKQTKT